MLNLKVRSFIGCERADIEINGITIVAGMNQQGKSSVLDGAKAALSGQVMPNGMAKGEAGRLVLKGEAEASVEMRDVEAGGTIVVNYPKAERITDGNTPEASRMAVGLIDYMGLKEPERAKLLAPHINAEPAEEDLTSALKDVGITGEYVVKMWGAITENGWDHSHTHAIEIGQKLKGQWEQITGDNYGSKKAQKWLPTNWSDDLQGESLEALEGAVTDAARTADAVVASSAVDADRLAQLTGAAEDLEPSQGELKEAQETGAANEAELREAREALDSLAMPEANKPLSCPHCGEPIKITPIGGGFEIAVADKPQTDKEKKAINNARTDAQAVVKDKGDAAKLSRKRIDEALHREEKAKRAGEELAKNSDTAGGASPESVAETKEAVRLAEERRTAFVAMTTASRKAKAIQQNQAIVALLAADGLRKTVLRRHLDDFANTCLVPLSEAAGWGRVTFRGDLSLDYASSPRPSGSEDYATQVIIQVALAKLDKSAVVVIDCAEIFDPKRKRGFIKLLREAGIPALVGMMVDKVGAAPDLQEFNLGSTYYMENGLCQAA